MAKRPVYQLTLLKKEWITPSIRRVVLTGPELADFPEGQEGSYMKLLLPKAGTCELGDRDPNDLELSAYWKRSYTIRRVDQKKMLLVLEVAHHDPGGPAAEWAQGAVAGDQILVTGPGPVQMLDSSSDWVFLAGDLTGLPGIVANLERLPASARGYAVIELPSLYDKREVKSPEGVQLHWLESHPHKSHESSLVEHVRGLEWLPGRVSVWAASEYEIMKGLREYFVKSRGLKKQDAYISSYWKWGASDEEHKLAKRAEEEATPG